MLHNEEGNRQKIGEAYLNIFGAEGNKTIGILHK